MVAAASSMAGSGDLLSFHVSSTSTGSNSRLRLPHVVGYYETDSRKPFPKDSKKWNVSIDQLKSAIVRLATHAGTNVLAADGIPSSWAAFAQHIAAIKEQAPNMPCISYDEVYTSPSYSLAAVNSCFELIVITFANNCYKVPWTALAFWHQTITFLPHLSRWWQN